MTDSMKHGTGFTAKKVERKSNRSATSVASSSPGNSLTTTYPNKEN